MDEFKILYFTDNREGEALAGNIRLKGITVKVCNITDIKKITETEGNNPVFVFDIQELSPGELVKLFADIKITDDTIKLVIASDSEIRGLFFHKMRLPNIEFISRPVDENGFSLLLEKIILIERLRESMRRISDESDFRIRVLEYLINSGSKGLNNEFSERDNFVRILDFEKKMIEEYLKVNKIIRNAVISGNNEFYYMKDRIKAEEMLDEFRRQELINARKIIDAQESVIEYSSLELDDAKKILDAMKNVEELSRQEALELHKELDRLENEKEILENRINSLKSE